MEKFNTSESPEKKTSYHNELLKYHHASKHEYQPGSQEEQRLRDWERSYEAREVLIKKYKEEFGDVSSEEVDTSGSIERVKDMLQIIDSMELEPAYADDVEQVSLLRTKKQQAKELIRNLLQKDVVEYVAYVRDFNKARIDVQQQNMGVDTFAEYDERRTRKHNVLIDSIQIVSRFIKNNFGVLTDEEQEAHEVFLESRGEPYLNVQRMTLPKNIICPDYIDLTKREEITDWALDVSRSLAELFV